MHIFTQKSEIERILASGVYGRIMQAQFADALKRSRQLMGVKRVVFAEMEFETPVAANTIVAVKKISQASTIFRTTYGTRALTRL